MSRNVCKNYDYALRNNPEERRSHLLRGGSLKSRIAWPVCPNNKSEKMPKRRNLNLILSIIPEFAWKLIETTKNLIQDSRIQAIFHGGAL